MPVSVRSSLLTSSVALRRLRAAADPVRALGIARYFKTGPGEYGEGDRFLGLTLPFIREISREFRDLPLGQVMRLLKSPWHEARSVALIILVGRYVRGEAAEQCPGPCCAMPSNGFLRRYDAGTWPSPGSEVHKHGFWHPPA